VTLEHVECLAACDLAPVLQVNYEFYDNQTPSSALEVVKALQRGERPAPTRGAPLADFRQVALQLAGFFDGRSSDVEGPSAAAETLAGADLAHQQGWNAPVMPEDAELPPVPEKK
jgi:NADH-quinone oxidoreductase subunit E